MHETHSDGYLSKSRLAQYLDRSIRWVDYQLTGPNPPPGLRIGKSWLFRRSEIDRWLEQFRTQSNLDRVVDEVMSELGGNK